MGGLWDSEPDSSVVKGQDQGWEFAHLLIAHSLIRSFAHFDKSNEQPWANCSGCSEEMSDLEQIAQVAQDKWAALSDSLRSLRENERMSVSLKNFC